MEVDSGRRDKSTNLVKTGTRVFVSHLGRRTLNARGLDSFHSLIPGFPDKMSHLYFWASSQLLISILGEMQSPSTPFPHLPRNEHLGGWEGIKDQLMEVLHSIGGPIQIAVAS